MLFDSDKQGLSYSPQPFSWLDDKGNEWRGVTVWAKGEEVPIRRYVFGDLEEMETQSQILMATACSRQLVWVYEDRLTPIPFRCD